MKQIHQIDIKPQSEHKKNCGWPLKRYEWPMWPWPLTLWSENLHATSISWWSDDWNMVKKLWQMDKPIDRRMDRIRVAYQQYDLVSFLMWKKSPLKLPFWKQCCEKSCYQTFISMHVLLCLSVFLQGRMGVNARMNRIIDIIRYDFINCPFTLSNLICVCNVNL